IGSYLGYKKDYSRQDKDTYYRQFSQGSDLYSLYKLTTLATPFQARSPEPIHLNKIAFGKSPFGTILKMGRPHCILTGSRRSTLAHKIYVYKRKVFNNLVLIYCHYIGKKLFLVQSCYPTITSDIEKELVHRLEKKYHCLVPEEEAMVSIINPWNEKIIIQKDFYLNLFYISSDPYIHSLILAEMRSKESRSQKIKENVINSLEAFI
ncbi:MAG TPA: hypothetical protein VHK91_16330, partial [Flavisolibacter sp.]|nr:hypothetical protein [Flavisolibacter sp.]